MAPANLTANKQFKSSSNPDDSPLTMREFRLMMEKLDSLSTNISPIQFDIATIKDTQRNLVI